MAAASTNGCPCCPRWNAVATSSCKVWRCGPTAERPRVRRGPARIAGQNLHFCSPDRVRMFPRVLFLLLLALCIGGASWIAFAPPQKVAPVAVSDPGVPPLVLLSERESGIADAAEAPSTTAAA